MTIIITGIVTASTSDSEGLRSTAIISAPIIIPGALSAILSSILTKFCSCVTSLVSLVTSEPDENLSIFPNEKLCTFLNISDLRSVAKLTDAFAPKYAPPTPPAIIITAVSTISSAVVILFPTVSVLSVPELITIASRRGMITSPITSTIIHNGPIIKYSRYGLIYLPHLFKTIILSWVNGNACGNIVEV